MLDRVRAALATLASAPWRRAPLLLRHHVGVLAAVAGATAVVAASMASVPLFTSSVGSASVRLQVEERCPRDLGASRRFTAPATEIADRSPDPFSPVADRLGPSGWWAAVEDVPLSGSADGEPVVVSILARDRALQHADVLDATGGEGVWLSDRAATRSGLSAGDTASLGATEVTVAGVYRDLSGSAVDDFWCSNADLLLLEGRDLIPPPPLVLADGETLAAVMRGLEIPTADGAWEAPLRPGLTLSQADALLGTLTCRDGDETVSWCGGGRRPGVPSTAFGRTRGQPVDTRDEAEFAERFLQSSLPFAVERTRAIQTSVGSGIWAIALLAAVAGLGLVAASASLWLDRRRREVALLSVRGVSPTGIGGKAVLEVLLALVAGAVVGASAAHAVIRLLGPSSRIEPTAIGDAAIAATIALGLATAAIWIVVAVRSRGGAPASRRASRLARLPWELALIWATLVSYRRLGEWGVPTGRGADVSRVDLWGLFFPVLFLITAVAVLARGLRLAAGPIRNASRGWPTSGYLGVRRLARYQVAAIGLVAGAAVAAGVLGYSATMNRSLDTTLAAKGRTFVGSDAAVYLSDGAQVPTALRDRSTEVRAYRRGWVQRDRRESLKVVAIDPDTFERAAFWDDAFSDRDLTSLLDQLRSAPATGAVPAVVVGGDLHDPFELAVVGSRTRRVRVEPIGGVDAFPGMSPQQATVYLPASVVGRLPQDGFRTETWLRGDPDELRAELQRAGTGFQDARARSDIADRAAFRTVSWTFGYLQTIGLAAGLLVIGGLAAYLDARSRQRLLGYSLMRRMGLRRVQHRRALAVELAASVLVGAGCGLLIGATGAAVAYTNIDPVPRYAPDPLLRIAVPAIVTLAVLAGVLTAVAVVLGQRRIDAGDPVEVLRAGT